MTFSIKMYNIVYGENRPLMFFSLNKALTLYWINPSVMKVKDVRVVGVYCLTTGGQQKLILFVLNLLMTSMMHKFLSSGLHFTWRLDWLIIIG